MDIDAEGKAKANGLKTVLDVLIAPREAFEQLRAAPTWGWALVVGLGLYVLAGYLMTPAIAHAMQADWPRQVAANPQLQSASPQEQQRILSWALSFVRFSWVFAVIVGLLAMFVQAIVMLIFKAVGRGDGRFSSLWASAVNIAVPTLGVGGIVTALIVLLRGPDAFASQAEVQTAMPSLALLVPATSIKLHAFLSAFTPFSIWGCALTIVAMSVVARVGRVWAWSAGIVQLLIAGVLIALAAR